MDGVTEYYKSMEDDEIIKMAKEAYEENVEYESEQLEKMRDDINFEAGYGHWDSKLEPWRVSQGRPCLVVPRANAFLNQVKNEQRQNKASIKISPRGGNSDEVAKNRVKAAENRQGIIRAIQYDSNATDAYQCAFDFAVTAGRGWWQVSSEYVSPSSMDQKIIIKTIRDPFNVTPDRSRKKFDYSDMNNCFYGGMIKKTKFKALYPDAHEDNWQNSITESGWMSTEDIRVTQLYCKWVKKRTLIQMDDMTLVWNDELEPEIKANEVFKSHIKQKRVVRVPFIMWYKMTSMEILERTEIPGQYIPMIPCLGIERDMFGELQLKGMMRDLKDTARMYDYWNSYEAEMIAYAPKSRYIAASGQVEKYKQYWQASNLQSAAVLPYDPMEKGGHLVPPPQIIPFPEVPMAAINAKMGCVDDMKAITGMHDPSLGARSSQSGKAILAEQRQGDNANYHFIDNLRIAITHTARIINHWLDVYYTPGTIAKILGTGDSEKHVVIGDRDPKTQEPVELGDADVDIVCTMGANSNTKRQEATEAVMELIRAVPAVTPLIYDIFVGNMDFPGAQDIAERLKKTIPKELLDEEGGEDQMAAQLQQAVGKIQEDQQIMQAMQQQIQAMMKELETKGIEAKNKMQIAQLQAQTDIQVASIKALTDREAQKAKITSIFMQNLQKPSPTGVQ